MTGIGKKLQGTAKKAVSDKVSGGKKGTSAKGSGGAAGKAKKAAKGLTK